MDDESATIFHADSMEEAKTFIIPADPNQTEITKEQMIEIIMKNEKQADLRPELEAMSIEALGTYVWDTCVLYFNSCAIIPISNLKQLCSLAKSCFKAFGGDTSTYNAVAVFNDMVKNTEGVKIIDFPQPIDDEEEENE
jgi:hypothetical protein